MSGSKAFKAHPILINFELLRKRNKVLFTLIVGGSIILFWKGMWGLFDIIFDEWLFHNHLFWSNMAASIIGLIVLVSAGLALEKLT